MFEQMEKMFTANDNLFMDLLEDICEDKQLCEKVREFNKVRKDVIDTRLRTNENKFNAILHSDAWCNNFLFK